MKVDQRIEGSTDGSRCSARTIAWVNVHNAVRFGFWGAEELGLLGSANYIQSLGVDTLKTSRCTSIST
jgi:Peptidase family M28